jgi:hypothetical protein
MSCNGRTWPHIGKKMLSLRPLAKQKVHLADSVLGRIANPVFPHKGLSLSYTQLIQRAFAPSWWSSADPIVIGTGVYTQMEANFSLFWGLAIQLYEATLVSDQTPFDRYDAGDATALTAQQQRGLAIFSSGKGRCHECHGGVLLSDAISSDFSKAFRDIGVRPVAEDLGAGGIFGDIASLNGSFKVPAIRNVELTGPYFHNGGKATLMQLIEFYDDGGDFRGNPNLDGQIRPLGLTLAERQDLEAFLLASPMSASAGRWRLLTAPRSSFPTGIRATLYRSPALTEGSPATTSWSSRR